MASSPLEPNPNLVSVKASAAALGAASSKPQPARDVFCTGSCEELTQLIAACDVSGGLAAADRSMISTAVTEAACLLAITGLGGVATLALRRLVISTSIATRTPKLPIQAIERLVTAVKSEAYKLRDGAALSSQLLLLATLVDIDPTLPTCIDALGSAKGTGPTAWLPAPSKIKDPSARVACAVLVAAVSATIDDITPVAYDHVKYFVKLWASGAKEPLLRESLLPPLLRLFRPKPWSLVVRTAVVDSYTQPILTALAADVASSSHTTHMAGAAGAFVACAYTAAYSNAGVDEGGALGSTLRWCLLLPASPEEALLAQAPAVAAAALAESFGVHCAASVQAAVDGAALLASRLASAAAEGGKRPPFLSSQLTFRLGLVRHGLRLWAATLPCDTVRCQIAEAVLNSADPSAPTLYFNWVALALGRALLSFLDPPTENAVLSAWGAGLRLFNGASKKAQSPTSASLAESSMLLGVIDATQNEAVELLATLLIKLAPTPGALFAKISETARQGVGIELVARAVIVARYAARGTASEQLEALSVEVLEAGWAADPEPNSTERAVLCAAAVACKRDDAGAMSAASAVIKPIIDSLSLSENGASLTRESLTALSAAASAALASHSDTTAEPLTSLSNVALTLLRSSIRSISESSRRKMAPTHNILSTRRLGLTLWEAVARLTRQARRYEEATIATLGTVFRESLLLGEPVLLRPTGAVGTDPCALGGGSVSWLVAPDGLMSASVSLIERLASSADTRRKRCSEYPMSTADLAICALSATFGSGDYAVKKRILVILFDVLAEFDSNPKVGSVAVRHACCTAVWMCLVATRKSGRSAKQVELAATLLQQLIGQFISSEIPATKLVACAAISELPWLAKISDVDLMAQIINPKANLTADSIIAAAAWISRVRGPGHSTEGVALARQQVAVSFSALDWTKSAAALHSLAICASTLSVPSVLQAFCNAATMGHSLLLSPSLLVSGAAVALCALKAADGLESPSQSGTASNGGPPIAAVSGPLVFFAASLLTFDSPHNSPLTLRCLVRHAGQAAARLFSVEASRSSALDAPVCHLATSSAARCSPVVRVIILAEVAPRLPLTVFAAALSRLPACTVRQGIPLSLAILRTTAPQYVLSGLQLVLQCRPDVLPGSTETATVASSASSLAIQSRASRMSVAAEEGGDSAQATAGLSAAVSRLGGAGRRPQHSIEASVKALMIARVGTWISERSFDSWSAKTQAELAASIAAAGSSLGPESLLGKEYALTLIEVFRVWGTRLTEEGVPLLDDLRVHLATAIRSVIADVRVPAEVAAALGALACSSNVGDDDASVARVLKALLDSLDMRLGLPAALLVRECSAVWTVIDQISSSLPDESAKSRAQVRSGDTRAAFERLVSQPKMLEQLPDAAAVAITRWCGNNTHAGPSRRVLSRKTIRHCLTASSTPHKLSEDGAEFLAQDDAVLYEASVAALRALHVHRVGAIPTNAATLIVAATRRQSGSCNEACSSWVPPILRLASVLVTSVVAEPIKISAALLTCASSRWASAHLSAQYRLALAVRALMATEFQTYCTSDETIASLWRMCRLLAASSEQQSEELISADALIALCRDTPHATALVPLALVFALDQTAAPDVSRAVVLCYKIFMLLLDPHCCPEDALVCFLRFFGKAADLQHAAALVVAVAIAAAFKDSGAKDARGSSIVHTATHCIRLTARAFIIAESSSARGAALKALAAVAEVAPEITALAATGLSNLAAGYPDSLRAAVGALSFADREKLRSLLCFQSPRAPPPPPTRSGPDDSFLSKTPPLSLNLSAYRS